MDWNALATTVLVIVGGWQIFAVRAESKKERTLNAAIRYDSDPTLDTSCRNLRAAKQDGSYQSNPRKYRPDVINLVNYLDTIAIGIEQDLYLEPIAIDFLRGIVKEHCSEYLNENEFRSLGLNMDDFQPLTRMRVRWETRGAVFRDGALPLWRGRHRWQT